MLFWFYVKKKKFTIVTIQLDGASNDVKLDKIPKLLASLPLENKKLVTELSLFAFRVRYILFLFSFSSFFFPFPLLTFFHSEKSEINKMTPKNLAIVFGPNLLQSLSLFSFFSSSLSPFLIFIFIFFPL